MSGFRTLPLHMVLCKTLDHARQSCGYTQLLHISDDVMSWTRFSNYRLFARGMYAYNSIYLIIFIHFVNTVNSPFYIVVYTYSSNSAPELYMWRILNGFIMSCKKQKILLCGKLSFVANSFFFVQICVIYLIYIHIYIHTYLVPDMASV